MLLATPSGADQSYRTFVAFVVIVIRIIRTVLLQGLGGFQGDQSYRTFVVFVGLSKCHHSSLTGTRIQSRIIRSSLGYRKGQARI